MMKTMVISRTTHMERATPAGHVGARRYVRAQLDHTCACGAGRGSWCRRGRHRHGVIGFAHPSRGLSMEPSD